MSKKKKLNCNKYLPHPINPLTCGHCQLLCPSILKYFNRLLTSKRYVSVHRKEFPSVRIEGK